MWERPGEAYWKCRDAPCGHPGRGRARKVTQEQTCMKALVTGFEPYGPWQRNPSGETARHMDGATIIDLEVTGLVLPVSFARAAAPLIASIDTLRPDIVLNLGQGEAVGVRVERTAVNRTRSPAVGD